MVCEILGRHGLAPDGVTAETEQTLAEKLRKKVQEASTGALQSSPIEIK
jgi:hypothetical protein